MEKDALGRRKVPRDQSALNALKLVVRNKGKKKLMTFVQKNGITTLGDIKKRVKKSKQIEMVEQEMLHCQIEEDLCRQ
jgi:hypothetical protein